MRVKSPLNERFEVKGEILERNVDKLPDGVLCRVKYNICNIGEKNRNNRIYEKNVWERVLSDTDVKEKLKNRTLYAHAEHPTELQSNTEKIAGIVTNITIDESNNKVYAIMEVLDTPYGKICSTLLKAGCGLGVSTRAEGELEECEHDGGDKYLRVIPEAYRFVTVDWTADPSTYGTYPEEVQRDMVGVVKAGLESKKIDDEYACALLEKMEVKEAVVLLESVKSEKKNLKETKNVKEKMNEARKSFEGHEFEYNGELYAADGYVNWYIEKDYGEDADGNRGIEKSFIDDFEVTRVVDSEGKEVEITPEIKDAVGWSLDDLDLSEGKKLKESVNYMDWFKQKESRVPQIRVQDLLKKLSIFNEGIITDKRMKTLRESKETKSFVDQIFGAVRELQERVACLLAEKEDVKEQLELENRRLKEAYTKDVIGLNKDVTKFSTALIMEKSKFEKTSKRFDNSLLSEKNKAIEERNKIIEKYETEIERIKKETAEAVTTKANEVFETKIRELKKNFDAKLKEQKSHLDRALKVQLVRHQLVERGLSDLVDKDTLTLLESHRDEGHLDQMLDSLQFQLKETMFHGSGQQEPLTLVEKTGQPDTDKGQIEETKKMAKHLLR